MQADIKKHFKTLNYEEKSCKIEFTASRDFLNLHHYLQILVFSRQLHSFHNSPQIKKKIII
jgi:hypothetical protein